MRTVRIYEEGETVMIKAKISKVIFEKERITYELKDYLSDQRYMSRFTDKEIMPIEERSSDGDDIEGTDRSVATSSRLADGQGYGSASHP